MYYFAYSSDNSAWFPPWELSTHKGVTVTNTSGAIRRKGKGHWENRIFRFLTGISTAQLNVVFYTKCAYFKASEVRYYTGGTDFYLWDAKHLLNPGTVSTYASVQACVHIHEGAHIM